MNEINVHTFHSLLVRVKSSPIFSQPTYFILHYVVAGNWMLIPSTLRNGTIADHCGFMFMENHTAFEKLRFKNVFRHVNEKPTFSNSSGLKNVFETLRFSDGLVWREGIAAEIT